MYPYEEKISKKSVPFFSLLRKIVKKELKKSVPLTVKISKKNAFSS